MDPEEQRRESRGLDGEPQAAREGEDQPRHRKVQDQIIQVIHQRIEPEEMILDGKGKER